MKRAFNFTSLLVFCLFMLFSCAPPSQYDVVRVVDGDTIIISYKGKNERIRLLCIDTPESVHPEESKNTPLGKIASGYTTGRLTGKTVTLEFEKEERDRYGRLLAYVIVEKKNFNLELIRLGLSPYHTAYGRSKKYDQEFKDAEKKAQYKKLGIWTDPEFLEKYQKTRTKKKGKKQDGNG